MKARYNIHGFHIEVASDHPMPFEMIAQDLRTFRSKTKSNSDPIFKFEFTALPFGTNGASSYPGLFSSYRDVNSEFLTTPKGVVSRYGRSLITVINDPAKRRIKTAIAPDPSLFPDPAYHYSFTQPLSPWLKQHGLFFLHSACVADEKKNGVLIVGHSRAGKSSLSLACVRNGFKFLSDEQPFMSRRSGRIHVYSFPRRIRLDRSVAALFHELKPILKSSAAERIIFPIERIWPQCMTTSCKPKILIFPKFHFKGRLKISELGSSQAMARILQDDHFIWYLNGPWKKVSEAHLALVSQLVGETKAYQLDYGTQDIFKIPGLFKRLLK